MFKTKFIMIYLIVILCILHNIQYVNSQALWDPPESVDKMDPIELFPPVPEASYSLPNYKRAMPHRNNFKAYGPGIPQNFRNGAVTTTMGVRTDATSFLQRAMHPDVVPPIPETSQPLIYKPVTAVVSGAGTVEAQNNNAIIPVSTLNNNNYVDMYNDNKELKEPPSWSILKQPHVPMPPMLSNPPKPPTPIDENKELEKKKEIERQLYIKQQRLIKQRKLQEDAAELERLRKIHLSTPVPIQTVTTTTFYNNVHDNNYPFIPKDGSLNVKTNDIDNYKNIINELKSKLEAYENSHNNNNSNNNNTNNDHVTEKNVLNADTKTQYNDNNSERIIPYNKYNKLVDPLVTGAPRSPGITNPETINEGAPRGLRGEPNPLSNHVLVTPPNNNNEASNQPHNNNEQPVVNNNEQPINNNNNEQPGVNNNGEQPMDNNNAEQPADNNNTEQPMNNNNNEQPGDNGNAEQPVNDNHDQPMNNNNAEQPMDNNGEQPMNNNGEQPNQPTAGPSDNNNNNNMPNHPNEYANQPTNEVPNNNNNVPSIENNNNELVEPSNNVNNNVGNNNNNDAIAPNNNVNNNNNNVAPAGNNNNEVPNVSNIEFSNVHGNKKFKSLIDNLETLKKKLENQRKGLPSSFVEVVADSELEHEDSLYDNKLETLANEMFAEENEINYYSRRPHGIPKSYKTRSAPFKKPVEVKKAPMLVEKSSVQRTKSIANKKVSNNHKVNNDLFTLSLNNYKVPSSWLEAPSTKRR